MSKAGVLSQRGDYYQILLATHWLIKMLLDTEHIENIQVESVGLPDETGYVGIDDIVVSYGNGIYRFIQAKKNQPDYKFWSMNDLKNELVKAWKTFQAYQESTIEFVSRTPFGDLQKIQERCIMFPKYEVFNQQAEGCDKILLDNLAKTIGINRSDAFALVCRIKFGSHLTFEEWQSLNIDRLTQWYAEPEMVILKIRSLLQKSECRLDSNVSININRKYLIEELEASGFFCSLFQKNEEILKEFSSISKIGRTWPRTIAEKKIPTSFYTKQILDSFNEGNKTVLIQGPPGSGKTCVLLDLADAIEADPSRALIFIRANNFIKNESATDFWEEQLPKDLAGKCSRLERSRHVVVIIDSLDVLSLCREHKPLEFFLELIDRLQRLANVSIAASCREFDLKFDSRLKDFKWKKKIEIKGLDFSSQVMPVLCRLNIDGASLPRRTKELLTTPQWLKLYSVLAERGIVSPASTPYELVDLFIKDLIEDDLTLGQNAVNALQDMAFTILKERSSGFDRFQFPYPEMISALCSLEVLFISNIANNRLEFAHQTLLESFSIRGALAKRLNLIDFIHELTPLPFIRLSVRAFLLHIRATQPESSRRQIRRTLSDSNVAYHLKRLIAESISDFHPCKEDWPLIRYLTNEPLGLFRFFLTHTKSEEWFTFLSTYWLPYALEEELWTLHDSFCLHIQEWKNRFPEQVLSVWINAIKTTSPSSNHLKTRLSFILKDYNHWNLPEARELILLLLDKDSSNYEIKNIGIALSLFVSGTNSCDDLLWKYIKSDIQKPAINAFSLGQMLFCREYLFSKNGFLVERLTESQVLLSLVLEDLSSWSEENLFDRGSGRVFSNAFLHQSSWRYSHEKTDKFFHDSLTELLDAIESSLKQHSRKNTSWWILNKNIIACSKELSFRYLCIKAILDNIEQNLDVIVSILTDGDPFIYNYLGHELGLLANKALPFLRTEDIESIQANILMCDSIEQSWAASGQPFPTDSCLLISHMPACYRTPEAQAVLDRYRSNIFPFPREPYIFSSSGFVSYPFTAREFLDFSDTGCLALLAYYDKGVDSDDLIGGTAQALTILSEAASVDPVRFLKISGIIFSELKNPSFIEHLLQGVANHLLFTRGNLKPLDNWEPLAPVNPRILSDGIINLLTQWKTFWAERSVTGRALLACSFVLEGDEEIEQFLSLIDYHKLSKLPKEKENSSRKLLDIAISSIKGNLAESLIILLSRLLKHGKVTPEGLRSSILYFAQDPHPAVRAVILRNLPLCWHMDMNFCSEIFNLCMHPAEPRLWELVEPVLYSQYHANYTKVRYWLDRWQKEGLPNGAAGFGRILALCHLDGQIKQEVLFTLASRLESKDMLQGFTQVFVANISNADCRENCEAGLLAILDMDISNDLIQTFQCLFLDEKKHPFITVNIAHAFLDFLKRSETKDFPDISFFMSWLSYFSKRNPLAAFGLIEFFLSVIEHKKNFVFYDHEKNLATALLSILREADESDDTSFIRRVIAVQDRFFMLNIYGLEEILYDAST